MSETLRSMLLGVLLAAALFNGPGHAEVSSQETAKQPEFVKRGTFRVKLELNVQGRIAVYVQDRNGQKLSTEGYRATVSIVRDGREQGPYVLTPAGGNKLETQTTDWLCPGGMRVITLWTPDGKAAQWSYEAKPLPDSVPATQ